MVAGLKTYLLVINAQNYINYSIILINLIIMDCGHFNNYSWNMILLYLYLIDFYF